MSDPLGVLGLLLVALIVVMALGADVLAPYGPNATNVRERLQPPSELHWLGTDQLGRDIFSRVLVGSRIALWVAAAVIYTARTPGALTWFGLTPVVPMTLTMSATTADAVSIPPAPGPSSVISRMASPWSMTALNAPSTAASG